MRSCFLFGHSPEIIAPGAISNWTTCKICGTDCYTKNPMIGTLWDSDAWETLRKIISVLFWLALGIGLLLWVLSSLDRTVCAQYSELDIITNWNFWTGCMAEHPKLGWVPIDKYFEMINVILTK